MKGSHRKRNTKLHSLRAYINTKSNSPLNGLQYRDVQHNRVAIILT